MKINFQQSTVHCIASPTNHDLSERFLHAIHEYTNLTYSCLKTSDGYFLEPLFRKMFFTNSFVPEIVIFVSQDNDQTLLHLNGQPVKTIRVFVRVWFIALMILGLFTLITAAVSGGKELFLVLFPISMGIFGYLLCELTTKATFHTVVTAIKREFS